MVLAKKTGLFTFVLLFLLSFSLFCRDASLDAPQIEEQQTLETLGTAIHTSLGSLKAQSKLLTETLEMQSLEVETLKVTLNDLNISLDNTNKQLLEYEMKIQSYKEKLKGWHLRALITTIIALALIATRIVTLILKAKGIHLPEIVNILL